MKHRFLILGGTKEAAERAEKLVAEYGEDAVTSSLAGRTKEPRPLAGNVRVGGFGGIQGLVDYLRQHEITQLIDATHPFALKISENAKQAALATNTSLEVVVRPQWPKHDDDNWIEVANLDQAVAAIPQNARVLLALGSQHIAPFAVRRDVHFFIRTVHAVPLPTKFFKYSRIIGLPNNSLEGEAEILRTHEISHIVCRNSGGTASYSKIEAARMLGIPVIIQQRKEIQ